MPRRHHGHTAPKGRGTKPGGASEVVNLPSARVRQECWLFLTQACRGRAGKAWYYPGHAGDGWADCNNLRVDVSTSGAGAMGVEYDIDARCRVIKVTGTKTEAKSSSSETQVGGEASSTAQPPASLSGPVAAAATSCNYIHSSQTLQDVVNIDIAKLRLHSNRCWNGSKTWMVNDVWARSSTSVSWNHPDGNPWFPRVDWNQGTTATAIGSANFHSDWLWCNLTADWQVISLTNTNVSKANGSYSASFSQSRACPGTHMATASKVSSSRDW